MADCTSHRLMVSFKIQLDKSKTDNGVSVTDSDLEKYASLYWGICMKKGLVHCPFPEHLVDFYKGMLYKPAQ